MGVAKFRLFYQATLHVHHALWYILLPLYPNTTICSDHEYSMLRSCIYRVPQARKTVWSKSGTSKMVHYY